MQFEFDPRTGMMREKKTPTDSIRKAVMNSAPATPTWDSVRYLREELAIAEKDGYHFLCVRLNGKWRECGIISNVNEIYRQSRGPLVNFHQIWQRGNDIKKPIAKNEEI